MFKFISLILLFVINVEFIELSPTPPADLCQAPRNISCRSVFQRFFYDSTTNSCDSIACSTCPQAHFLTAANAVRCCTTGDVTACNPTLTTNPCNNINPPTQYTFAFNPATNQAVSATPTGCPVGTGRYYASLSDCQTETQIC